ncbi:GDP-mannose transporter into the lumen of the Golgi [Claviceps pazoutovae]|uniref:GDP-mannose transporter n=1 Tax=Claviceps pazoutovae TaxID=1649127 RepID=A0A9P7MBV7_9HYPO|nr:GDP-mannose transporter into the lumen of the Golgi [Claviceps pazoutovae]KAG5942414.1 GDP-mannose transporter into the lumen of the Golgi [Claviceps monticola]
MSDKKSDDLVLPMPANNGYADANSQAKAAPVFTPARSKTDALKGVSSLDNNRGASVLAYCLSSMSMTIVNKYVISGSDWNMNLLYLAVQSIVGTAAIVICKQAGLIKDLGSFDSQKAKGWFPVALLLVAMIYTGNKALQFLSVPVYTIFKNLTIIVIAYGEVMLFGSSVSPLTLVSFAMMVFSSVIAAWADAKSAASAAALATLNAGYAWMGVNVFCAAMYALSVRKVIKKTGFNNWEVMYYNNLLTIPVLILSSLLVEDWSAANLNKNFPVASRGSMATGMVYSGLGAIFISYSTAWCIRATSSTTYAMVGALNKLPVAILGIIFFAAPVTFGSVSAILLGFVSGIVYTVAKLQNKPSPQPPALPLTNKR